MTQIEMRFMELVPNQLKRIADALETIGEELKKKNQSNNNE